MRNGLSVKCNEEADDYYIALQAIAWHCFNISALVYNECLKRKVLRSLSDHCWLGLVCVEQ
ncbi:hypothetical protein D3C72_2481950 [compost metagenome]